MGRRTWRSQTRCGCGGRTTDSERAGHDKGGNEKDRCSPSQSPGGSRNRISADATGNRGCSRCPKRTRQRVHSVPTHKHPSGPLVDRVCWVPNDVELLMLTGDWAPISGPGYRWGRSALRITLFGVAAVEPASERELGSDHTKIGDDPGREVAETNRVLATTDPTATVFCAVASRPIPLRRTVPVDWLAEPFDLGPVGYPSAVENSGWDRPRVFTVSKAPRSSHCRHYESWHPTTGGPVGHPACRDFATGQSSP